MAYRPRAHKLIGKVVRRMCHEEIVVTVHGKSGATAVVSLRVAHGEARDPVGGEYQSDIPSSFVASESSQSVDVQLNGLDDRHAVRLLDAVADRAEPEILVVAAMVAASS